jgi:protein-disulfide isomerase
VAVCLHRTACLAARGGICAAAEGRFWEYADACYADRTHHQRADLVAIARGIGLDPDRFDACLDAPSTASALAEDIEIAHSVGVRATPTIVLNGVKFEGAIDLPRLTELLDRTEVCSCDLSTEACACDHDRADCECGTQVVGRDSCGL